MRNSSKSGFAAMLSVLVLALAVLGLGATVLVSQKSTGLTNFASSRNGSKISLKGLFPITMTSCPARSSNVREIRPSKCVLFTDSIDGKTYFVRFIGQEDLNKFSGKQVRINGVIEQNADSSVMQILSMGIKLVE